MAHLSLHVLPKEGVSDHEYGLFAERMKPLRLQSLRQDTFAFISKYESEKDQPMSFWTDRLKQPEAWHAVMVRNESAVQDDAKSVLLRDDVKWVAFMVMIDTESSTKVGCPPLFLDEN
jgi:hypothetical protein